MRNIAVLIKNNIWNIPVADTSQQRTVNVHLIQFAKILIAAAYGFVRDQCYLKASALTFYSLLSIVPVLAVAFGIAKGFGFEQHLEAHLFANFTQHDAFVTQAIDFAYTLLEHTQGGLIAGAGVITLFFTVCRLLSNIEGTFNQIWKTKRPRSLSRKFSDYLATMIICPVFLVSASSLNVYVATQVMKAAEIGGLLMDTMSPILFLMLKLIPFFLIWTLFLFTYRFMPNVKVSFGAGLFAAVITGTAYQFLQWGYIYFQLKLTNYGAVYGSFAALPLFLVWLQVSWIIVLAGAELAYFAENHRADAFLKRHRNPSFATKKRLAVIVTNKINEAFKAGEKPLTAQQLASVIEVPLDLAQEIIEALMECMLISEVNLLNEKNKGLGYQPARDPDTITPERVCDALENLEM